MNITAMSLTNGTLTVIVDNGAHILTAGKDHPRWTEIQDAYKIQNHPRLLVLLSLPSVVEEYTTGQLSVNNAGVTYAGRPLHTVDSDRVMAFLRDGLPYQPIANYIARKMANPSARAITELYSFLEHKNMPITPDGFIIAYKGVQPNLYSVQGNKETIVIQGITNEAGQILNEIGATIEVRRNCVSDDFRQPCAAGLHAGSLSYAKGWGTRVILVAIDPADVVSVPADCDCQKLRCCKYKVIGEYTGALPNHYTDEFTSTTSSTTDDSTDHESVEIDEDDDVIDEPEESNLEETQLVESTIESPQKTVPQILEDFALVSGKVIAILTEQLGLSRPPVLTDKLLEDIQADSLDAVEIMMALEEEFNIEIPEDADQMAAPGTTVNDIVQYVIRLINSRTQDSDHHEKSFLNGINDGVSDRAAGKSAKYLAGDQLGADSDSHAYYINGYINGYAN